MWFYGSQRHQAMLELFPLIFFHFMFFLFCQIELTPMFSQSGSKLGQGFRRNQWHRKLALTFTFSFHFLILPFFQSNMNLFSFNRNNLGPIFRVYLIMEKLREKVQRESINGTEASKLLLLSLFLHFHFSCFAFFSIQ